MGQVIVQSTKTSGKIKLTATAENLPSATVAVSSEACLQRLAVPENAVLSNIFGQHPLKLRFLHFNLGSPQ
jgi:hypothetical protein